MGFFKEEGSPMSEQDGKQSSTQQRRSRKTSTANQQNGKQILAAQRPTNDDKEAWQAYWRTQGQPWRTEPEIGTERQKYLAERRIIKPDIKSSIYPFMDIKLSRADVEWLLATHENGRGPVDWNEENQRARNGLDMRGANLRQLNLSNLPLTRIRGGLNEDERMFATAEMCEMAAVHLEGANLQKIHLERADLYRAHLEEADLYGAFLERAYLNEAHLTGANLYGAHLERTQLRRTHLEGVKLGRAHFVETELEGALLSDGKHVGPRLADAYWSNTNLAIVDWSQLKVLDDEYEARQSKEKGEDKDTQITLYQTAVRANRQLAVALQTQGLNEAAARFAYHAQLCQKYVLFLQLMQHLKQQIKISWVAALLFVEKPKGKQAEQRIAELILLLGTLIFGFGLLLNSHWSTHSIFFAPPSNTDASFVLLATIFGIVFIGLSLVGLLFYFTPEASLALFFLFMSLLQVLIPIGVYILLNALLSHLDWLLMVAISIWILLFIALFIGRFKFNSWFFLIRKMSNFIGRLFSKFRPLVGVQIAYGRYIFAWLLDLLAGYGYRPGRSIIAYLLIIGGFASLYTAFGQPAFPDSFVFSVASFHGRGFFPNFEGQHQLMLSNPLVVCAAIEAVIGLIIEISFIATFTQRFFGK